jgi:hypothetical protein
LPLPAEHQRNAAELCASSDATTAMPGRERRHATELQLPAGHDRNAAQLRTSVVMPTEPPDSGRRLLPEGHVVERSDLFGRHAATAAG